MNMKFMDIAYEEAMKAFEEGEIPVGCVIVYQDQVIARAHNQKEKLKSAVKHAEILAVDIASGVLNNWRLENCDVYVTLEPCPMCASALKQARVRNIYCGLANSDSNNFSLVNKILASDSVNPSVSIYNNLDVDRISKIMKSFFENRRNK